MVSDWDNLMFHEILRITGIMTEGQIKQQCVMQFLIMPKYVVSKCVR